MCNCATCINVFIFVKNLIVFRLPICRQLVGKVFIIIITIVITAFISLGIVVANFIYFPFLNVSFISYNVFYGCLFLSFANSFASICMRSLCLSFACNMWLQRDQQVAFTFAPSQAANCIVVW